MWTPRRAKKVAARVGGIAVECDVSDPEAIAALVATTETELGPVELAASNAGITDLGEGLASSADQVRRITDINLLAHVWMAQAVVPGMVRGHGALVQTLSSAALITGPSGIGYTLTKHGALGFAEWMALNYAHLGIRVACLCPNAVYTGMLGRDEDHEGPGAGPDPELVARIGDVVTPEECATAVLAALDEGRFLALPHPPRGRVVRQEGSGLRRVARADGGPTAAYAGRAGVRVGLYFDLRNPPAWPTDWSRLYGFTLELCEEADRLGCHSIWLTEHHLFDDGYLPQPLAMAAAVRRGRARHASGPASSSPRCTIRSRSPSRRRSSTSSVRATSRWASAPGTGSPSSGSTAPTSAVATPPPTTHAGAAEAVDGRHAAARPGPRPDLDGLPGPHGAARAGRLGEGLLSADGKLWPIYREALVAAGHSDERARMTGGIQGWTTDDPERDWPVVSRHLANQLDSYRRYMVEGTDQPAPRPVDPDRMRQREPFSGPIGYFLYGTPEQVAADVRRAVADAPVDAVYFWASIAGMPEDLVATNVRTVCERLAPLLA